MIAIYHIRLHQMTTIQVAADRYNGKRHSSLQKWYQHAVCVYVMCLWCHVIFANYLHAPFSSPCFFLLVPLVRLLEYDWNQWVNLFKSIVRFASADLAIAHMIASEEDNISQADTVQDNASASRSKNYFFLPPKDVFKLNADSLAKRAECLKPYELSNVENVSVTLSGVWMSTDISCIIIGQNLVLDENWRFDGHRQRHIWKEESPLWEKEIWRLVFVQFVAGGSL